MWKLLEDYNEDLLWSGLVLRIFIKEKTEYYYIDQVVDMMLFENYNSDDGNIGILIISGDKAGKINFIFPTEAYDIEKKYAIKKQWLMNNLYNYLYLDKNKDIIFIRQVEAILPFS